ncbi:MAG: hypothetical protein RIF42_17335 [Parvibaculaceae bacterium]
MTILLSIFSPAHLMCPACSRGPPVSRRAWGVAGLMLLKKRAGCPKIGYPAEMPMKFCSSVPLAAAEREDNA